MNDSFFHSLVACNIFFLHCMCVTDGVWDLFLWLRGCVSHLYGIALNYSKHFFAMWIAKIEEVLFSFAENTAL